jgi:hypothetical protein
MYLPGGYLGEGTVDQNGFLTTADRAIFQAKMDAFFSALVASAPTLVPHIIHTGVSGGPVGAPPPTAMTSFAVQLQVATQRRRMR